MSKVEIAGVFVGAHARVLIALRVPLGAAMFIAGAGGYWWMVGDAALLNYLKGLLWARFSVYDLSVIPLFLLMGQFASAAGFSRSLFHAANTLVGHRNAGVAQAAIIACACFGAISRLVGRDRRDHVAGRAAGDEAPQLFGPSRQPARWRPAARWEFSSRRRSS